MKTRVRDPHERTARWPAGCFDFPWLAGAWGLVALLVLPLGLSFVRPRDLPPAAEPTHDDHLWVLPSHLVLPVNAARLCASDMEPSLRELTYEGEERARLGCFTEGGCPASEVSPMVPGDVYVFTVESIPATNRLMARMATATEDPWAGLLNLSEDPASVVTRQHYTQGRSILLEPRTEEPFSAAWVPPGAQCSRPAGRLTEGVEYAWFPKAHLNGLGLSRRSLWPEYPIPFTLVTVSAELIRSPRRPFLEPVTITRETMDSHFLPPPTVRSLGLIPFQHALRSGPACSMSTHDPLMPPGFPHEGHLGRGDPWYRWTVRDAANGNLVQPPQIGPVVELKGDGFSSRLRYGQQYRVEVEAIDLAGKTSEPVVHMVRLPRPARWLVVLSWCCFVPFGLPLALMGIAARRRRRLANAMAMALALTVTALYLAFAVPLAALPLLGVAVGLGLQARGRYIAERLRVWDGSQRAQNEWVLVPLALLGDGAAQGETHRMVLARVSNSVGGTVYRGGPRGDFDCSPLEGSIAEVRELIRQRSTKHAMLIVHGVTLATAIGGAWW